RARPDAAARDGGGGAAADRRRHAVRAAVPPHAELGDGEEGEGRPVAQRRARSALGEDVARMPIRVGRAIAIPDWHPGYGNDGRLTADMEPTFSSAAGEKWCPPPAAASAGTPPACVPAA